MLKKTLSEDEKCLDVVMTIMIQILGCCNWVGLLNVWGVHLVEVEKKHFAKIR